MAKGNGQSSFIDEDLDIYKYIVMTEGYIYIFVLRRKSKVKIGQTCRNVYVRQRNFERSEKDEIDVHRSLLFNVDNFEYPAIERNLHKACRKFLHPDRGSKKEIYTEDVIKAAVDFLANHRNVGNAIRYVDGIWNRTQADRTGKIKITAGLDPEFKRNTRLIKARYDINIQDQMAEAFNAYFVKNGLAEIPIK